MTWERSVELATLDGAGSRLLDEYLVAVNTTGNFSPGYTLIIRLDAGAEKFAVAVADPDSLSDFPQDLPPSGLDWDETVSFISGWGIKRFEDGQYADAVQLRHFSNID
ncbi:hypothetical protein [Curtobacterium sp. Leaf261]|uniref:hypothetical protein n=1 Tax=Curtobacterium sp. Leaf261 TaxID=1736311 RepID=UPI00138F96E0|nr:hypothetical protein [Curtobacterium sp. Leaf261]